MGSIIIKALVSVIEKNPALVEELIEFGLKAVASHAAAQKAAGQ